MYSIFVTLRVKEEYSEAFVRASFGDSIGSIKNEPNCYRFDVLRNSNDSNLFHLYEVYKDEYSHKELHLNMPHFLKVIIFRQCRHYKKLFYLFQVINLVLGSY